MTSIDVNVNNIFFRSYSSDPDSGCPIYVFDSTYLPSFELINDKELYELLLEKLMDRLLVMMPKEPFSLVIFSSGFLTNNISWVYGIKMYAKIPKETRSLLRNAFVVHESFFVKTVFQVIRNAMSIKFINNKETTDTFIHVPSLTGLSSYLDITRLRISLNVYLYDYQLNEKIIIPSEFLIDPSSIANRQYRQLIFDRIFKRLQIEGVDSVLVFQKPGSYKKINILLDIIERNHYVDLSQWDIYSLGSVFLNFLKTKSKALIPLECIPLPVSDDLDYTKTVFTAIVRDNGYYDLLRTIFPLFIKMLNNCASTGHDMKTMSKALTATLCKEKVSLKSSDRLAIGNRYIRNIFTHFYSIIDELDSVDAPALPARNFSGRSVTAPELPKPRKSSPTRYNLSPSPSNMSPVGDSCTDGVPSSKDSNLSSIQSFSMGLKPKLSPPSLINSNLKPLLNKTSRIVNSEEPHSPSKVLAKDIITDNDDSKSSEVIALDEVMEKLTIEKNAKIEAFDKELKMKKMKQQKTSNMNRFSDEGYSEIVMGSKVSKLAALYEERLQGLQAISEIK